MPRFLLRLLTLLLEIFTLTRKLSTFFFRLTSRLLLLILDLATLTVSFSSQLCLSILCLLPRGHPASSNRIFICRPSWRPLGSGAICSASRGRAMVMLTFLQLLA